MGAAATICHDLTAAVGPSWLASIWSSGFRGRLNFLCALAMHPNEHALQEYREVARSYRAIHTLLGTPAPRDTVQMLARLGYLPASAAPAAPAPRGLDAQLAT